MILTTPPPPQFARREKHNLAEETKVTPGLVLYGLLEEGMGFKEYLHGPMDAGTKLKVKFRTGDIALRQRGRRYRTLVDEHDVIAAGSAKAVFMELRNARCTRRRGKRTWLS